MKTGKFIKAYGWQSLLFAIFFVLAGCGGSSSSSSSSGTPAATVTATGGAAKGILKNALVTLAEWDDASHQFIATSVTTHTDDNGQFNIDLPDNGQPLLVTVTADSSTDMVCDVPVCQNIDGNNFFGQTIHLSDYPDALGNFTLKAILPSGQTTNFAVTPLTTLAAAWVEKLSGDVNVNTAAVNQALSRVADLFDLNDDFYTQLPADITDGTTIAGKADLLSAAFYVNGDKVQDAIDSITTAFINNGGQLPLNADPALTNTFNALINRANEIANLITNSVLGGGSQLQDVIDSFNNAVARWGNDATITSATSSAEFSPAEQEKFDQSKALFTQLETYLHQAGIDENGTFVTNQAKQINWLYEDPNARADTASMIGSIGQIAIETALITLTQQSQMAALPASFCVSQVAPDLLSSLPTGVQDVCANSDGSGYTLKFNGDITTPNGHTQAVDAAISIPKLVTPLTSPLELTFGLTGTNGNAQASMSNPTVSGKLGATLTVNVGGGLLDLLTGLAGGSTGNSDLETALFSTTMGVTIANLIGQLTRESASTDEDLVQQGQSFDVALDASLNVDMSAISMQMVNVNGTQVPQFAFNGSKQLLTGTITDGHFNTPRGDYLKALTDNFCSYEGSTRLPLKVVVADTSTAEGCFAAKLAEIPELDIVFQGQLTGAVGIVNQVISGFIGTSSPVSGVIDGLDLDALGLSGTAKLLVKDEEAGYQTYHFTLDRNKITATQEGTSNSIEIYLTGLNGGYLTNAGVWVGSFRIDWANLGLIVQLADGTDATFALGSIFGALDPQLLSLIMDSLGQIDLGGLMGST